MGILESFWDFLKKNPKQREPEVQELSLKKEDVLDVDRFNKWFQDDYSGYGGYKGGAKGIYLRTDKLSSGMIEDYFDYFKISDIVETEIYDFEDKIRRDWLDQRTAPKHNELYQKLNKKKNQD